MAHEGEKPDLASPRDSASHKLPAARDSDTEADKTVPDAAALEFSDGGLQAWLVVSGSACVFFCTLGYLNSFGIFQQYYHDHQLSKYSQSDISWIGSVQFFLQFAGGAIGGPLFDRHGTVAMLPASILYVVSIALTSFCREYYQFFLAQAVLGGICNGIIFTPAVAIIGHYFFKKRGLAMGIVVAGSSLGGVIFPIILNSMLYNHHVSFGWSVRACALICLILLGFANIVMRPRLVNQTHKFDFGLMRRPIYILTVSSVCLLLWGMFIPFFYIPDFGLSVGVSQDTSVHLVAILNATSLFGRILGGHIADKLGRFNVLIFMGISSAIFLFCWAAVSNPAGVIVISALMGFFLGGIVSLMAACVVQITPHPKYIGALVGYSQLFYGIAGLSGAPIAGALLGKHDNFSNPAYFGGAALLVGGMLLFAARMVGEPRLFKAF